MAKTIDTGFRVFPAQPNALKHFKKILHHYSDDGFIDGPERHVDLVGSIERYDIILEKVGEPVKVEGQITHSESGGAIPV